jgi:hypothetical protein
MSGYEGVSHFFTNGQILHLLFIIDNRFQFSQIDPVFFVQD